MIPMDRLAADTLAVRRVSTILLATFSAVAFVLAVIGIYGVMSFTVAYRTHELGVRLALGASGRSLIALVVREGMLIALTGIALGLVASFTLTRILGSLLFAVTPTDPRTFFLVSSALTLAALLACTVPALRAARLDPLRALHHD
jgi:putative ABC transport system permease protein